MRWLASSFGVVLALCATLPARAADLEQPTVRQAIQSVLEMETWRQADRLPRVTLDTSQADLTVVFAMRRPLSDDRAQLVNSATDDVFNILWATYTSSAASQIRTTTV